MNLELILRIIIIIFIIFIIGYFMWKPKNLTAPPSIDELIQELKKTQNMEPFFFIFRYNNYTIEDYYNFFRKACEINPEYIGYMNPIFRGVKFKYTLRNTNETNFLYKYLIMQDYCCGVGSIPNEKYRKELKNILMIIQLQNIL